ncbi:hypothetical protein AAKU55_001720 [Oxalobacteraceae bacterium GrIS 1.11]
MNSIARPVAGIGTFLRLGRVSNLPTVWSNVLAGSVLAGADLALAPTQWALLLVLCAVSAFYVGGMYLNDAFDRAIDARERPSRPIPAGEVSAATVFAIGFALLAAGIGLLARHGTAAMLAGCALALTILVYDTWHKANPSSPVIMGWCRALVYIAAAAASGAQAPFGAPLMLGAAAILAHVVGLTYAAKQESLDRLGRLWPLAILALPPLLLARWSASWPLLALLAALATADLWAVRLLVRRAARGDVPKAVAQLIAATSLVDGAAIAGAGGAPLALLACVAAYAATRLLQRIIPGT